MEPETENVPVNYYLHVQVSIVAGEQEWGPYFTRDAALAAANAIGARENVLKITIERRVLG